MHLQLGTNKCPFELHYDVWEYIAYHSATGVSKHVLEVALVFQNGNSNGVQSYPHPKSRHHDHYGNNIFQATVKRDDGKSESVQGIFTSNLSLGHGDS